MEVASLRNFKVSILKQELLSLMMTSQDKFVSKTQMPISRSQRKKNMLISLSKERMVVTV